MVSGNRPYVMDYDSRRNSDITFWCSNDYLGMGQHSEARSRCLPAAEGEW